MIHYIISNKKSGFNVNGFAKNIKKININEKNYLFLVSINSEKIKIFKNLNQLKL